MYNYVNEINYDDKYKNFQSIRYIETEHCDSLECYSLLFYTQNGLIYYSGDSGNINVVKSLIANGKEIDKLYIDTTTVNSLGNDHLYIGTLYEEIPDRLRSHVYCMHINNDSCISQAEALGFNVVEVEHEV